MKLNKLMAVLAAGVSVIAATEVSYAGTYYNNYNNLGITNLPLSFAGTFYTSANIGSDGGNSITTSNLVKKGGNLQAKNSLTTTNYTVVETNGSFYSSYTYASYGISNFVSALNADPLFNTVYPAAPANAQLAFNLQTGEFWLTASNYAFNLSSNWWVYSWTNVIQTPRMYYTNIYTVSNTFASAYSASERLQGWYSDSCGYSYPYTNTYNVNNDFTGDGNSSKNTYKRVLGFTGSLSNPTAASYSISFAQTNVQVGEVYLSTGTNLQFALTGFTIVAETQTANTNTTWYNSYAFPAVSTATLSSSLNGSVGYISQVGGYSTNSSYRFYGNLNWNIIRQSGGFIGTATGSKTASSTLFIE